MAEPVTVDNCLTLVQTLGRVLGRSALVPHGLSPLQPHGMLRHLKTGWAWTGTPALRGQSLGYTGCWLIFDNLTWSSGKRGLRCGIASVTLACGEISGAFFFIDMGGLVCCRKCCPWADGSGWSEQTKQAEESQSISSIPPQPPRSLP